MPEDLGGSNKHESAGDQSELTKPTEHQETGLGFPSLVYRPNHYGQTSWTGLQLVEDITLYDHVQHGKGVMKNNDEGVVYRGSSHWDDVFHEVGSSWEH